MTPEQRRRWTMGALAVALLDEPKSLPDSDQSSLK
jgi:hypothetical protein